MSLSLRFVEIRKTESAIISSNKTIGVYEVNTGRIEKVNEFDTRQTDLFEKLLKDPHSIWEGEVYNIPWMNHFAFYILALDFESNTGFRNEGGSLITLAWEPKSIDYVIEQAIANIQSVKEEFSELHKLTKHAYSNNNIIMVSWG